MYKVLIVDDDTTFALILSGYLKKHGFEITTALHVKQAIELLSAQSFNVCLLDYRLPDGTGLDILQKVQTAEIIIPAVMMTSMNDVRIAVKAMRMGAYDFITKPVNQDELLMVINEVLSQPQPNSSFTENTVLPPFVKGESEVYQKVHEQVLLVGPTDMSAILQGESGTGKEYIARLMHMVSKRAQKPFIAIDCGTLTRDLAGSELFGHIKGAFTGALQNKVGRLEEASGGTLFLDEIGNLGYDVQVKLLRVIQERIIQPVGSNKEINIDVRIIAASNEDLWQNVQDGKFREDLYHRLNEFKIKVPPLRERGSDIDDFANFFREASNKQLRKQVQGFTPEVWEILHTYSWPGNIREMKNMIKRMVLLANDTIAGKECLPEEIFMHLQNPQPREIPDLKRLRVDNEKELIEKVLTQVKFNKTKAAKLLNIDRSTLYAKMQKYEIEG